MVSLGSRVPCQPCAQYDAACQGGTDVAYRYPVWTGIGAVGTVVLGIVFFHEPASFLRLFFITTLIASIVGLKMVSH